MKIIGIIPARYSSTRLLGKPLIRINNKPLVQLTYDAVSQSKLFDLVFIATESKKIKSLATNFGAQCILTSDKNINGTERCAELIDKLNSKIDNQDLIINIQCDEPFIKKNHLKKVINLFKKNTQIGTLISPIDNSEFEDPSIVKLNINNDNTANDFGREISNFKKKAKLYKHIGIYAYSKQTLFEITKLKTTKRELSENLEQLRWMEYNYTISCSFINENLKSINTKNDIKNLKK